VEAIVEDLREIAKQAEIIVASGDPDHSNEASANKAACFSLRRYLPFAQRLLSRIGPEWLSLFSEKDKAELFDAFFDGKQCPRVCHPSLLVPTCRPCSFS
jgi:hypothetical protein